MTFDGLEYIASYADLRTAFGANGDAGSIHFITSGRAEGRVATFDGLEYIASYPISRMRSAPTPTRGRRISSRTERARAATPTASAPTISAQLRGSRGSLRQQCRGGHQPLHHQRPPRRPHRRSVGCVAGPGGLRVMAFGTPSPCRYSINTGGYRGPLDSCSRLRGRVSTLWGPTAPATSPICSSMKASGPHGPGFGQPGRGVSSVPISRTPCYSMIGTNDIINFSATAHATVNYIVSVVNNIHAVYRTAHVLVAGLLPTLDNDGAKIGPTNAGLANATDSLEDQGRAVSFVYTSSVTLADSSDWRGSLRFRPRSCCIPSRDPGRGAAPVGPCHRRACRAFYGEHSRRAFGSFAGLWDCGCRPNGRRRSCGIGSVRCCC